MSTLRCLTLLILTLVLVACASGGTSPPAHPVPLVLVSIDGFRPDYLERGLTPTLARLAEGGTTARLRPAFPTLTFPNHYTLVTGLQPDHHGVVHNRMRDPETGARFVFKDSTTTADPAWWGGEPLWVSVEKSGRRAATMFWPGSEGEIAGHRPGAWMRFDSDMPPAARVDQALAWLNGEPRPALLTLYFEHVDSAGHAFGPDSAEVDAALAQVDEAMAQLVEGLDRFGPVNLVVLSDHGMAATDPALRTHLDDVVPLDAFEHVQYGTVAGLDPKPGREAEVMAALDRPHPHMDCWDKASIPARFAYGSHPRVPPIVCLAHLGGTITNRAYARDGRFSRGEHGYDNAEAAMQALFVAHGPAFRAGGKLGSINAVDVYPLLARLAGITPAANDGNPGALAPALKQAAR